MLIFPSVIDIIIVTNYENNKLGHLYIQYQWVICQKFQICSVVYDSFCFLASRRHKYLKIGNYSKKSYYKISIAGWTGNLKPKLTKVRIQHAVNSLLLATDLLQGILLCLQKHPLISNSDNLRSTDIWALYTKVVWDITTEYLEVFRKAHNFSYTTQNFFQIKVIFKMTFYI